MNVLTELQIEKITSELWEAFKQGGEKKFNMVLTQKLFGENNLSQYHPDSKNEFFVKELSQSLISSLYNSGYIGLFNGLKNTYL